MKKIIPFTKDIKFNTKIYEITSISLEHNLSIEDNNIISGEFVVSGDYKINDSSINTEPFIHGLPFDITLDTKYDMNRIKIDIDDFKFEIINEEILRVEIDVLIEGSVLIEMEEEENIELFDEIKPDLIIDSRENKDEKEENLDDIEEKLTEKKEDEERNIFNIKKEDIMQENNIKDLFKQTNEEIVKVDKQDGNMEEVVKSIFNNFSDKDEKYVSYYVHIVRENDNIESISNKYGVSVEVINEYNNIEQITLGNKIIIPYINESI